MKTSGLGHLILVMKMETAMVVLNKGEDLSSLGHSTQLRSGPISGIIEKNELIKPLSFQLGIYTGKNYRLAE